MSAADQIQQMIRSPSGAPLSAEQVTNAYIIAQRFEAAGYGLPMIMAAIANAYAESSLLAWNIGDKGASVGLFQLYDKGAGAGMTVDQRKDAITNTDRIIKEVSIYGKKRLIPAYQNGTPFDVLADLFCQDIERPADAATKGRYRAEVARAMFPTAPAGPQPAPAPDPSSPSAPSAPSSPSGPKWAIGAILAATAAALLRRR